MTYEDWVDIGPILHEEFGDLTGQRVRVWSLVLSSQFIDHRVAGSRADRQIWVKSDLADESVNQIRSYEEENLTWAPSWLPARTFSAAQASFAVLAAIALVHMVTAFGLGYSRSVWLAVGSSDAGLIRRGELWRTVTALTLHADVLHLMSNIIVGGFFVLWLCKEIGPGLGWLTVLLSGILGNLINAFIQSPLHNSIGASTALFGAIGILSGLRAHESASASRGVFVPLVAGIILLAFLGAAGERTDVGAHLFGLVSGVVIGALLSTWLRRHAVPGRRVQRLLGAGAVLVLILSWIWGLSATL